MSEVFDQPQLDIQSPENAVLAFEERGESLEGHMERGSIEDCPVMGRMSEDAQQFIVSRVVEHAEKASAFKGVNVADMLAKKRQTETPAIIVDNSETVIEPPKTLLETNLLPHVEIEKTIELFKLEASTIETVASIQQDQNQSNTKRATIEPLALRPKAKTSIQPNIIVKASPEPPRIPTTNIVTAIRPEVTDVFRPDKKASVRNVRKIVPIAPDTRSITTDRKKNESVPSTKIVYPEVEAFKSELPAEADLKIELSDKPIEEYVIDFSEPETIQVKIENTETLENDELPIAEVTIEQIVEAALLQIEELHSQPEIIPISPEANEEEAPVAAVIAEIAHEILNLSEVPETVEELKRAIIELIVKKSDILDQFDMKVVWPYIEQLIDTIQSGDVSSNEYLNRLNSSGTHEHKFYSLWQGKSPGAQASRYYRVSRYILGSTYAMSA